MLITSPENHTVVLIIKYCISVLVNKAGSIPKEPNNNNQQLELFLEIL